MLFMRKMIKIRFLRLKIYKGTSSSKCNDYFIILASYYFHNFKYQEKILIDLQNIVEYRRFPNERFLSSLKMVLRNNTIISSSLKEKVLLYLKAVSDKPAIRLKVIQNVTQFLKDVKLTSDTCLVLYGYSTAVCQSLVSLREGLVADGIIDQKYDYLPCPVFWSDLQYGADGSLNEHLQAQKHLQRGHIKPIILPFDQLALLFASDADFLHAEFGKLIPLSRKRRIIGIIGCEVCDTGGNVWIPAHLKGRPSETAKFVELFRQIRPPSGNPSLETFLTAVTESYKINRFVNEEDTFTFAPIKGFCFKRFLLSCWTLQKASIYKSRAYQDRSISDICHY